MYCKMQIYMYCKMQAICVMDFDWCIKNICYEQLHVYL